MATLYELADDMLKLYDMVWEDDGEGNAVDPQLIADTIEAKKGELEAKAEGYAKLIRQLESDGRAYKAEKAFYADKQSRAEKAAEKLRERLKEALIVTGLDGGIDAGQFTIKVADNGGKQPVAITMPEEEIPDEYVQIKRIPDKDRIREFLEEWDPEGTGAVGWATFVPRGRRLVIK